MNLQQLAKVKSAILITGATGTGKTTLAQQIHNASQRRQKNFVSVNLAGLSDELFLSELFGHRKGSFTGAYSDKQGYCDLVQDGTLFLDEIGDLTPMQQKYLLKLIDEKKYKAIGDTHHRSFTGTIVMATHKDLEQMAQRGQFRQDLYFRIRVFQKHLPPLSEMDYELSSIITHALSQVCQQHQCRKSISAPLLAALLEYAWPGNYRELKNTLEYMVLAQEGESLLLGDLPSWIGPMQEVGGPDYQRGHECWERQYLIRKLALYNGKINETATMIGISKVTLISKIKRYTIDVEYIKILSQAYKTIPFA